MKQAAMAPGTMMKGFKRMLSGGKSEKKLLSGAFQSAHLGAL